MALATAAQPYRERLRELLISAYDRDHRPGEALGTYHRVAPGYWTTTSASNSDPAYDDYTPESVPMPTPHWPEPAATSMTYTEDVTRRAPRLLPVH
jgi:hypothetical protein